MSEIVEQLRSVKDANLRVAANLDAMDFEVEYIRDDLEEIYSDQDLERAYQQMLANQVSADNFRKGVKLGNIECQTIIFEGAIIFLFPSSRYTSIFTSFDRKQPFPLLEIVRKAGEIDHISA